MHGQWYGQVKGTNSGVVVLNVDVDRPSNGRLMFSDVTVQPAYCSIEITREGDKFFGKLTDFHVDPFYPVQNDIRMPESGELKGYFANEWTVEGEWVTDVGTYGQFVFTNISKLEVPFGGEVTLSWADYKEEAITHKKDSPATIFRGQSSSDYVLTSSLYREKRWDLIRYYENSSELRRFLSEATGDDYNIDDMKGYTELLYLAQHHGFPTPLLDWTESPFIAAFFAFHKHKKSTVDGCVSIYAFDQSKWVSSLNLPTDRGYFGITQPVVQVLGMINAKGNPRAIAQQSVVTFSNIHNVESYVGFMSRNAPCLKKYNIPVHERNNVMEELRYMGITAATVFPGLDGTCQMLKEKMF